MRVCKHYVHSGMGQGWGAGNGTAIKKREKEKCHGKVVTKILIFIGSVFHPFV